MRSAARDAPEGALNGALASCQAERGGSSFAVAAARCAAFAALRWAFPALVLSYSLLDRDDDLGAFPAEALQVEVLDELGQRGLPGLLVVVVERAELVWVHPELSCRLHVSMRESVAPACLSPGLELGR